MSLFGSKKPKLATGPTGGLFFFFSLVSLLFLAVIHVLALPSLAKDGDFYRLYIFLGAGLLGGAIAQIAIRGRASVFLHEFKHSLVSHFAGNRAKEMKVRSDSGHFTYEFSKDTAHFNAFISLAPYFIPLCTVPAFGVGYLLFSSEPVLMVAFVGLGFGADLLLNFRDISPHQSDFTSITGGYTVGLTYVLAMNITLITLLLSWVLHGVSGISKLLAADILLLKYTLRASGLFS